MTETGLQPERTALSWSRTGWASIAIALLYVRALLVDARFETRLGGIALASLSVAMLLISLRRSHQLRNGLVAERDTPMLVLSAWLCVFALDIFTTLAFNCSNTCF
ncbi:DUF202 domain-containing protein [Caballeronia arvi]|uniref:DUF202 domain-containing protein n=1 Tax=Caballeronia arvi TaxID=1777135 RepID=UPI000772A159